MGMFSYRCRGCGHPMLSHGTTNEVNDWMKTVVALLPDGTRMRGEYDGYGRVINSPDVQEEDDLSCADWWHHKCWTISGRPEFADVARDARGQGFIGDEGDHDMPEPKTPEDVVAGQASSEAAEKKVCAMWASVMKKD
jgi:hypothetical protein